MLTQHSADLAIKSRQRSFTPVVPVTRQFVIKGQINNDARIAAEGPGKPAQQRPNGFMLIGNTIYVAMQSDTPADILRVDTQRAQPADMITHQATHQQAFVPSRQKCMRQIIHAQHAPTAPL